MRIISDSQISSYLKEKKILPKNFRPNFNTRSLNNHFELDTKGENGNIFRIIIRRSKINPLDFSVILGVVIGNEVFRLKRYNGDSHEHTNSIEKETIEGFHIHTATERYQTKGHKPEDYAQKTLNYYDWNTALQAMLKDNNFVYEVDDNQKRLVE